jgi:hypothetical protein
VVGGVVATAAWGLSLVLEPVGVPPPLKPASYELEWSAPGSCPDAETIRKRIAALVPTPEGGDGVMFVHAVVEPTSTGFALVLDTEYLGSRRTRRLEARKCLDLGESTALVIAVALEPAIEGSDDAHGRDQAVPEAAPVGYDDTTLELSPAPTIAAPAPARQTRPKASATDVLMRAAIMLEGGSMPRVGGGNAMAVGVLWKRFRLELTGAYLWPRRDPSARGLYQLGSVGGRGCVRLFGGSTEFPICIGVEGGILRVESRGLDPRKTLHPPWIAPLLGAGVGYRGRRVGFWSMAELFVTARGSKFVVGSDRVFRTLPVSMRFLGGVEVFFSLAPGS